MQKYVKRTQLDALRHHFSTHPRKWISLSELHSISRSLAIAQRVADLRDEGWYIQNWVDHTTGRKGKPSFYRYLPERVGELRPAEFDVEAARSHLEDQLVRYFRKWPRAQWPLFADILRAFAAELDTWNTGFR